jgi:hypothetical protein
VRSWRGVVHELEVSNSSFTEATLEGRQPPDMTLDTLIADMSADWNLQRKQLVASSPPNDAGVCA